MAQGRVIRPGQEGALAEMLGRGADLPAACRFTGGQVATDAIVATYACPSGEVVLELREARVAPAALPRTDTLAVAVRSGAAPRELVEALLARVRSGESTIEWSAQTSGAPVLPPARFSAASYAAIAVAVLLFAGVLALLTRRRGRRALLAAGRRAAIAALCVAGIAAAAELTYRTVLYGTSERVAADAAFELYGLGESTMVGQPFDPKVSIPRLLDHMFGGEIAGRRLVVKNLAERGAPLYPQALAFERALDGRVPGAPGAVLIMSGHNEAFVPAADGAATYLPALIADRSALLRDLLLALRRRRLIDRERSLAAYEYYLRRTIETARAHGLLPILTTMASNIARIEPNVGEAEADPAAAIVEQGLQLEQHGNYAMALDLYRARFAEHPTSAALSYRAGRCAEALGDFDAAREHYWTAVDLDSRLLFGRATRAQNDFIRQLAREYEVPLVDAVQILEDRSPHGLLGDALFIDGQHPSLAGYLYLAEAYAGILSQRFATPIRHPLSGAGEVAAALAVNPQDTAAALVTAGSWLIATSVTHPFPLDRMTLAEKRFRSLLGDGDNFSAWFGIALAQAAARGGLLRNPDDVAALGNLAGYNQSYRVAPDKLPALLARFTALGVDAEVLQGIRGSSGADAAPRRSR